MVKCIECGLLSLRNIETRELDEAEETFRQWGRGTAVKWSYPVQIGDTPFCEEDKLSRYIHASLPICFARNGDFSSQLKELIIENYDADKVVLMVIGKERHCEAFIEWQQGFTPKEHREMTDRKYMIELEDKRRKNDRKWHWIELTAIIVGTGFFTLLGAWIASPK